MWSVYKYNIALLIAVAHLGLAYGLSRGVELARLDSPETRAPRIGEPMYAVLARLGRPDIKIAGRTTEAPRGNDTEVWKYGCRLRGSIATIGTLYFGAQRRVSAVFGFNGPTHLPELSPAQREDILDMISSCPGILGTAFSSRRLVSVADSLLAHGRGFVLRAVAEYVRLAPRVNVYSEWWNVQQPSFLGTPQRDELNYRVATLLWALFPPELNPGMPDFSGVLKIYSPIRAAFPLSVVDGVPFMILEEAWAGPDIGYEQKLLRFCLTSGVLRRAPLVFRRASPKLLNDLGKAELPLLVGAQAAQRVRRLAELELGCEQPGYDAR